MFFQTLMRRAAALPKFDFARNPYKSKRTWPPDFTKLSQKHQFRLERRYRRRAKLKWARPTWTKFVKLATWGTISFVVVYGLLFMEIEEGTVFGTIRDYYARATNDMFGTPRRKPRATLEDQESPRSAS
ncbi:hypothetical protein M436DRAFT_51032 [Aureobasidium namibiae CBS 147.97]|uniref:Uncharacterized protein n=1 Tax=Aureobasidium namibiae CBS 147.97 TaxID=1043004 RepID=A0A074WHV0_9PEZI